jgi:hypothetical protein
MSATHTPTGAQNNGVKTVDSVAEAGRVTPVDAAGAALDVASKKGAPSFANGQVTAGAASAQVVAARATRRAVLIRNTDAANSAYVGGGAVTSGNGFLLKAGESVTIETTAAVNAIRATADVVLAYVETYD